MPRILKISASLFALLALPFLAACHANSTRWGAEPPKIAVADQAVRKPVQGVVDIPDRSLFEDEAARLWAQDRVHLGVCVANVEALDGILTAIEGQDPINQESVK